MRLEDLVADIMKRADEHPRFIIAIAGPPAAGKSTVSEALRERLLAKGVSAEILPMDGFHLDNGLLETRRLLPRKGAPETFDVRGFLDIIAAVRKADQEVLVPVFDRSREIAIASARAIAADTRFILVEGNYLLLNESPWTRLDGCFDYTIFIGPDADVLTERLTQRWTDIGMDPDGIAHKLYGNDLPNGERVIRNSRPADLRVETIEL
jgi:pantothenate kinase